MITVAVNKALYASCKLKLHKGRALDNGATQAEISEISGHVVSCSALPTGMNASRTFVEVLQVRRTTLPD